MKILLVGDYPNDPRLGSTKVYVKLRETLVALGHGCDVMLGNEVGTPTVRGRLRWALGPLIADRAIARQCHLMGPYDVLDIASAEALIVAARRQLGAAEYRGTAIVNRSHGLEHLNYQRMCDDHTAGLTNKPVYRRVWYPLARMSQVSAAARRSDRMILLNETDRAFAIGRRWKTSSEIDVIPHGVSTELIPRDYPATAHRHGILFCGSWDAVKGISYLVDAFVRVAANTADATLTILGPGHGEHDVRSSFPGHVRGRIRVIPRVEEADVMQQYRQHALLVMSSTYEGFGLVVLEAMSQGLPVVATSVGAAPALVRDGVTGLLVPPRSAEALAAAMLSLLDRPVMLEQMGRAALEAARAFTWLETGRRTVESYEAAIGARR